MSPDNPLPVSIEQELIPNSQIPLTTHEFRTWKEKQGFEVGHRGTAYNAEKKAYLYTKSAWTVSDLDAAQKSLKVLGMLKEHKVLHPGMEFGLSDTGDGRVQVFGIMRKLEEFATEKNGMNNRQVLKTGINEQNMYDSDSHVVSWIKRIVPDYDPSKPNNNPMLAILSDYEARHTHNWAWDKDGTAYPVDMEVIHLNDENGGVDSGNTTITDAINALTEAKSEQSFFYKEGIKSYYLADAYSKLFDLVQANRPNAFEGYVHTRSGFYYQASFGRLRQRMDESGRKIDAFRGYVQINPLDVPAAIKILSEIALKRLAETKRTEFKVMLGTNPALSQSYEPKIKLSKSDLDAVGVYNNVSPNDAELVMYGEDIVEVADVLRDLGSHPDWQTINKRFIEATKSLQEEFVPRGSIPYVGLKGAILSLSYNDHAGNHED